MRYIALAAFAAFVVLAIVSAAPAPAHAYTTSPGCWNPNKGCLAHCLRDIPRGPDFDLKMQQCINYWGPRNLAKEEAIRKAKQEAGRH